MYYLSLTSLLAALGLLLSVVAAPHEVFVSPKPMIGGYYPSWRGLQNPPDKIEWDKYSFMTFAFAATTSDSSVIDLGESGDLLSSFVGNATNHSVLAFLSIGGWAGSQYFSPAFKTAENRSKFITAALNLVEEYHLDGLDIDWEYPGSEGIGCNQKSADDSANLLSFLRELRANPRAASNLTLTAAVGMKPFNGSDGTPLKNVSEYATLLNYTTLMVYDVWGSAWSQTVGPNAPLNDSCASHPAGSAVAAVNAWNDAGFPSNQLLLGVPAYGHGYYVTNKNAFTANNTLALDPPFDKSQQIYGPYDSKTPTPDVCGNLTGPSSIFGYRDMISDHKLTASGSPAPGINYLFDGCSATPFIYNATSNVMISYDDSNSMFVKGLFIATKKLGGANLWEVTNDYNAELTMAISAGMAIGYGVNHSVTTNR